MAYVWACTLLLFFLLVARLCDATDHNILDFALARRHELWMAEYGRVYKDEAEKAARFEIFKRNVKYVEDFNSAGNHSYTLGVNEFADLTNEEFVAAYTGLETPEEGFEVYNQTMEMQSVSVPRYVDWRNQGVVTAVKHQGGCSCCWAFTAAATVESLFAIKTGVLYDLSVQQMVDCDNDNSHCKPGFIYKAYNYIRRNGGLTTWANYPYTAVQGYCDAQKERSTVATISGYVWVAKNNEQALKVAVAQQPVAVAIEASSYDLQLYKGGIFRGYCGTALNHAVTVIGYGDDGRTNYWIVKNSWGRGWGENGFIRMQRDIASPEGLCGIASRPPLFPVM